MPPITITKERLSRLGLLERLGRLNRHPRNNRETRLPIQTMVSYIRSVTSMTMRASLTRMGALDKMDTPPRLSRGHCITRMAGLPIYTSLHCISSIARRHRPRRPASLTSQSDPASITSMDRLIRLNSPGDLVATTGFHGETKFRKSTRAGWRNSRAGRGVDGKTRA